MENDRPPTPKPVKRALRQEAGFGCCACGNPILRYHHVIPYSVDQHFRVEDMLALCPNHHAEADAGVLSEEDQRGLKNEPFNRVHGFAAGQLSLKQRNTIVDLGGHKFYAHAGELIRVDGDALLTTAVSDVGSLLLGVRLFDHDDELLAEVVENEWLSHDPLPWDIEFAFRELHIRNAPRQIALHLDCRTEPVAIRGELWRKGRRLKIDAEGLHVDDAHMIGGGQINGAVLEMEAATAGTTGFRLVAQMPAPASPPPVRRSEPKIGRNDLCPCGSGKKYKRCHGA